MPSCEPTNRNGHGPIAQLKHPLRTRMPVAVGGGRKNPTVAQYSSGMGVLVAAEIVEK